MTEALSYIYDIFSSFITFMFSSDSEFIPSVSLGWFFVSCFVFSILIRNVLNIPNKSSSIKIGGNSKNGSNDNN